MIDVNLCASGRHGWQARFRFASENLAGRFRIHPALAKRQRPERPRRIRSGEWHLGHSALHHSRGAPKPPNSGRFSHFNSPVPMGMPLRDERENGKIEAPQGWFGLIANRTGDHRYPPYRIAASGRRSPLSIRWTRQREIRPGVPNPDSASGKGRRLVLGLPAEMVPEAYRDLPRIAEIGRAGTSARVRGAFPLEADRRRPTLAVAEFVPRKPARSDREALRFVLTLAVERPALESRPIRRAARGEMSLSAIESRKRPRSLEQYRVGANRPRTVAKRHAFLLTDLALRKNAQRNYCADRHAPVPSSFSCRRASASCIAPSTVRRQSSSRRTRDTRGRMQLLTAIARTASAIEASWKGHRPRRE